MRAPSVTDQGGGASAAAAPSFGRYPSLVAWILVAILLVLTGSRWPSFAYGTLALAVLYLLVTNTEGIEGLVGAVNRNLSTPFSR